MREFNFLDKKPIIDPVFVCGATRSGKIILSRIISALKRSENITVDANFEQLLVMNRLKELSDKACTNLLNFNVFNTIYYNYIGRNTNFRMDDFSSIWRTPNPMQYIDRIQKKMFTKKFYEEDSLLSNYRGDNDVMNSAFLEIKKQKIIFHMMVHYSLMHINIMVKSFPNSIIFHMDRNPIDLVYSWLKKGYGLVKKENLRSLTLAYNYKGQVVPYYAFGWEDLYLKSNEADKVIYIIENIIKTSNDNFNKLSNDEKSKIIFINYDDLIYSSDKVINNIENTLSTISTEYMEVVLKEENVPRKMDINIRKDKLAYIKDLASVNGMNILTKITESFL